jgi:RimJ/RimL family protein N-acetyltransferase
MNAMIDPAGFGNVFTGELVRLSAWGATPEFSEARARWSADAEFTRNYNFGNAVPRSAAFFDRMDKKEMEKENEFRFTIRTLDGDKLIGECGTEPMWNHQVTWVYIGIGEPEYRGRGYGTDAMRVLCRYSFQELGQHRIVLNVFSGNPRAIRSYEKVGFVHEANLRQSLYRDGVRYDTLMMGLLRSDWEAKGEL